VLAYARSLIDTGAAQAPPAPPTRLMADLDVQPDDEHDQAPNYTLGEMILWLVGILAIPLVPILMVWFFTPWSGM
jgi:hypothetical protein